MRTQRRLAFDPVARAERLWRRRWGAGDSMGAATSIMRVQQLLLARYDEALRPYGLTFARYEALVLLHFSRSDRLPLSIIGERLMVHPTSVTNIIQRLEQAGLVDRVPNPRDGRGTLAGITPSGLDLMQRATADLVALDFGLEAIDARERRELFRLLRKVRLRAGDFADDEADPRSGRDGDADPALDPGLHTHRASGDVVDGAAVDR
jgi:DNA-binding MarR family transcriptional regulator